MENSIENELAMMQAVKDDFKSMEVMLRTIEANITEYPASVQLGFIKPIKNMIFEATRDSQNGNDSYLNQNTNPINV